MAFSSWFSSHSAWSGVLASSVRIAMAEPIVCLRMWRRLSITWLTETGAIRIRWIREKASSWVVSLAPRRLESSAASASRFRRGSSTLAGEDLQPADHRRQQVVEVVSDAAGEPADRLHLLGLAKRLLGPFALGHFLAESVERGTQLGSALLNPALERRLGLLRLGDVVGNADEADMLAPRAPTGLGDRPYPPPCAVATAITPFERERLERRFAGQRFRDDPVVIVRMKHASPVEIDGFLIGYAEKIDIGAVDEVADAVEFGHPHQCRRAIGD